MRTFKHRSWVGAACTQSTLDLFFPEEGEDEKAALAKEICHTCPLEKRCLDVAIEDSEKEGVWGGMEYDERRKQKLQNNRSFGSFIKEIEPAIDAIVSDYMFAQDVLDAQGKVQAL